MNEETREEIVELARELVTILDEDEIYLTERAIKTKGKIKEALASQD